MRTSRTRPAGRTKMIKGIAALAVAASAALAVPTAAAADTTTTGTAPAAEQQPGAAAKAAAADVSWGVEPSSKDGPDGRDSLTYELKPGESITDYVGVSNFGTQPVRMHVYAMDALMTSDGAFTLPP